MRKVRIQLPNEEIIKLYQEGMSEQALAKKYDVTRNVIVRRLNRSGIRRRTIKEACQLHMNQLTTEQKRIITKACHDKVRGSIKTHSVLVNRAKGIQEKYTLSIYEKLFLQAFQEANISVIPQFAIDIFNVDFAIPSLKLAIEIDGGNWHDSEKKRKQDSKKTLYLTLQGWKVVRFSNHQRKIEQVIKDAISEITPMVLT